MNRSYYKQKTAMYQEYKIQILEQPAERIKFRSVAPTSKCQAAELLYGRNVQQSNGKIVHCSFPTVRCVPKNANCCLRPNTYIRMSLVDVRSKADNIIDHYHNIVQCGPDVGNEPDWNVTIPMGQDGVTTFEKLGIFKGLEEDRVARVTERQIARREEQGSSVDNHLRTTIKDQVEPESRVISRDRLMLCFEAFLFQANGRITQLAEPVFSDPVIDYHASTGELPIPMMSINSDFVEGGATMMIFLGNSVSKVAHKGSSFIADFFREDKGWSVSVPIPNSQLHLVGTQLGGLYFQIPCYENQNISQPVQCWVQFRKIKNKSVEAKSDPYPFTYKPRGSTINSMKRKFQKESGEDLMSKIQRFEQSMNTAPAPPASSSPRRQVKHPRVPRIVEEEEISASHVSNVPINVAGPSQTLTPTPNAGHLSTGASSREHKTSSPSYFTPLSPQMGYYPSPTVGSSLSPNMAFHLSPQTPSSISPSFNPSLSSQVSVIQDPRSPNTLMNDLSINSPRFPQNGDLSLNSPAVQYQNGDISNSPGAPHDLPDLDLEALLGLASQDHDQDISGNLPQVFINPPQTASPENYPQDILSFFQADNFAIVADGKTHIFRRKAKSKNKGKKSKDKLNTSSEKKTLDLSKDMKTLSL